MQLSSRIQRILSNLIYLLGRYLSKKLGNKELFQSIVENFLDGWNDGYTATWMRYDGANYNVVFP